MFIKLSVVAAAVSRGGQKKPKNPNRLKNQIETEPTGLVLVLV